jgi:hypothetical protein
MYGGNSSLTPNLEAARRTHMKSINFHTFSNTGMMAYRILELKLIKLEQNIVIKK